MEKLFQYSTGQFKVGFRPGMVSIHNDDHLWRFLQTHARVRTQELVDWVQTQHEEAYGHRIRISDQSFVMEIWGHVYFEYFMLRNEKVGRILFPFGLYSRLVKSCEEVDCGESPIDHNRWLWDILGIFTPIVGRLIPRNALLP